MKKYLHRHKAFTLVELLIVIAIIGVLAAISVMGYRVIRAKAQDAKRKADLRLIAHALEAYALDHGDLYPFSRYNGRTLEYITSISKTAGGTLVKGQYIDNISQDPVTNGGYKYTSGCLETNPSCTGGEYYILEATLSDGTYYQLAMDNKGSLSYNAPPSCGISKCNPFEPLAIDTPPTWVTSGYYINAVKVSDTSVKINWGIATDIVPPVSYKVYYGQTQQKLADPNKPYGKKIEYFSPSPSVTPLTLKHQYIITGLTPKQDFKYKIAAVDIIGQETLTKNNSGPSDFYTFSWRKTTLPYWRTSAKFTICTSVQCDPGYYYGNITEKNKVGVYVSGACGRKLPPGAIVDCEESDGAILEYKKTLATEWEEISFYPIGFPGMDGGRQFYLGNGTYDFRVRIFNSGAGSTYFPYRKDPDPKDPKYNLSDPIYHCDADTSDSICVKTGYLVDGKPDGEDIEPPLIASPVGFGLATLGSDGKPCPPPINDPTKCYYTTKQGLLKWKAAEDNVALDHYKITITGTWNQYDYDPITHKYTNHRSGTVKLTRTSLYNQVMLPIDFYNNNITIYTIVLTAYDVNGNSSTYTSSGYQGGFSQVFVSDP